MRSCSDARVADLPRRAGSGAGASGAATRDGAALVQVRRVAADVAPPRHVAVRAQQNEGGVNR